MKVPRIPRIAPTTSHELDAHRVEVAQDAIAQIRPALDLAIAAGLQAVAHHLDLALKEAEAVVAANALDA